MSTMVPMCGFGFGGGGGMSFTESETYPGCYFHTVDGVTEWLNPPMVLGTEYRTVERFKNKPVYRKAINFGTLPDATSKRVSTGVTGATAFLSVLLTSYNSNSSSSFVDGSDGIWLDDNNKTAVFDSTIDRSSNTGTLFLKYIK